MPVQGREKEYKILKSYISKFMNDGISTSLYISGVPGSGKTFTLKNVLEDMKIDFYYLNVAYIKKKSMVYSELFEILKCNKVFEYTPIATLREHFSSCSNPHIVILDEIDLLIDRQQELLYNIFDLPHLENSKILLFLISNTSNLPEKMFESKIISRIGTNRLNFKPYTHTQISKIISKVKIDKTTTEIISRKIGSVSGDLRKAINVTKKIEDKFETLNNALENIYQPLSTKFLKLLSYYQKLILYVIVEYKEDKYSSIYESHKVICNAKDIECLNWFEFEDVMELLKTYKIINFGSSKLKVVLNIFSEDLEKALSKDEVYNSFSYKLT
ncbi:Origin recognition complex subunit 1 [Nosema bombycis CQ1]|uniref:Origin recognition complex subunit 1 n=1 Tax=Nosema bombycis (strain CQ1 / CVCC 102059) TaxID=578461 RepID=R0KXP5_NOSB1|nr:Origin recognition complex subunit 1 [Nosema bombycis CQ1]|eukprot:EOB14977.1 Origin recognition complex subunit 1 [Nosema bombycis CQ1]